MSFEQLNLIGSMEYIIIMDDRMLMVAYMRKARCPYIELQAIQGQTLVQGTYQMVVEEEFAKLFCSSPEAIQT